MIALGAPSTAAFASPRPRPVSSRTTLITDSFFAVKHKLSNITVDETTVTYEKAYTIRSIVNPDTGITETVPVLDEEQTEKNRQKAILDARKIKLNQTKTVYANNNTGISQGSYTFDSYHNNNEIIEEPKTYSLIPVGIIVIETDTDYTDEIIVCVNITENCCADNSSYSYAVP